MQYQKAAKLKMRCTYKTPLTFCHPKMQPKWGLMQATIRANKQTTTTSFTSFAVYFCAVYTDLLESQLDKVSEVLLQKDPPISLAIVDAVTLASNVYLTNQFDVEGEPKVT